MRAALVVVVLALVCANEAAARTAAVQVLARDGNLVAAATSFPFAYPADGSLVRVDSAQATVDGVTLGGIAVLGNRVHADRLFVPARGIRGARVEGLIVDGLAADDDATNQLIPLGAGDYVVVLQTARIGTNLGLVGLRVVSEGQQVVLAPSAAVQPPRAKVDPRWSVLGFSILPSARHVEVLEPFPMLLQPSAKGQRAVQLALQFLGIPYVWGGATPAGFDCSGLVMWVYGQLGVSLTHYSGAQFHEGIPVARDRLLPGDVVFFHPGPNGPQHEGLYIGNGEFVHAPHTGDVVKVSSFSEPAYGLTYAGAVRPG